MKRLVYQVSVGTPSKLYQHCIASVADYCKRHDMDHYVLTRPKLWIKPDPFMSNRSKECQSRPLPLPIYEKENAFEYLPKYDQIAIIDADIYVKPTAPNIFDEFPADADFGACVEREMPIQDWYLRKIINYSHMQYDNLKDVDWKWNNKGAEFMNMGLILLNQSFQRHLNGQTPAEFLGRREHKRFIDGMGNWKWSTDQTLLNWFIRKRPVNYVCMDWKWNALYSAVNRLDEAHFVHFFLKDKLPNRGEDVSSLMKQIGEHIS